MPLLSHCLTGLVIGKERANRASLSGSASQKEGFDVFAAVHILDRRVPMNNRLARMIMTVLLIKL
jgi:hypothetical protein